MAINKTADQAAVPEPRDGPQAGLELSSTNGPIAAVIDATYQGAVGSSDGARVWVTGRWRD